MHCHKYLTTEHWSDTLLLIPSYWTLHSPVVTNMQSTPFTSPAVLQCMKRFPLLIFSWHLIKPIAWFCTFHVPILSTAISPFTYPEPHHQTQDTPITPITRTAINLPIPEQQCGADKQIHHCERHNKGTLNAHSTNSHTIDSLITGLRDPYRRADPS
jgi:hypothetical protein